MPKLQHLNFESRPDDELRASPSYTLPNSSITVAGTCASTLCQFFRIAVQFSFCIGSCLQFQLHSSFSQFEPIFHCASQPHRFCIRLAPGMGVRESNAVTTL